MDIDLSDRQPVSWRLLGAVIAIEVLLTVFINLVLFRSAWAATTVFSPVRAATGGLVTTTLLVNLLNVVLVVAGLLILVRGLRLKNLGLERSELPVAIGVTIGLWAALQVVAAGISLVQTGTVRITPSWGEVGVEAILGPLVAQLFGNALYEGVLFRAVLLDQLVLKLRDRRWGFPLALVGSQTIFEFLHVPNRLLQGNSLAGMAEGLELLFLMGLLFALVYHRTGSLLIAVGVHAVNNAPTMLVATPLSRQFLVTVLLVGLVAAWPVLQRSLERVIPGRSISN
jgi:membrane protease YdiL (CAAX protease family)